MPDRVLRDELLTSPRYWAVSIEAQRLYVHLILVADDTARFSGKNYTIRAACFPGHPVAAEKLDSLLAELVDQDLVRVYEHAGERYLFIPRYRQRMRYPRSKYPPPPQQINDIPMEKTDLGQSQDGLKSAEVKRSEVKRRKTTTADSQGSSAWRQQSLPKRKSYSPEFEVCWRIYPARGGDNPKARAYKAWCARIKQGHQAEVMTAGAERYAAWVGATGKRGTEHVKQAATFFGPDESFLESWAIPGQPDPSAPRKPPELVI